jgi:DNA-binding response OmpR family regulator
MSGYNDSRLVNSSIDNTDFKLLVKPFTPEELIERVRALTEGAARALVAE